MNKRIVAISLATVVFFAAFAFAGESLVGLSTTTGYFPDAGLGRAGAVDVPQGAKLSIQCLNRSAWVMFSSSADAGLYDGGGWKQPVDLMLPTSSRYGERGVLFYPYEIDGGSVECRVFSRVGDEQ